jgi:hypothetical protein
MGGRLKRKSKRRGVRARAHALIKSTSKTLSYPTHEQYVRGFTKALMEDLRAQLDQESLTIEIRLALPVESTLNFSGSTTCKE